MECEKVPKNKLLFLNITPCGITHEMNDCCCIPNLRNRYTFLLWVNIIPKHVALMSQRITAVLLECVVYIPLR